MKKNKVIIAIVFFMAIFSSIYGQKDPTLYIDSTEVLFNNVSLPYWLKAGQSVGLGVNAKKVSILEFNINSNTLEFERVISLTSNQIVPINKAWKIEGIGLNDLDTSTSFGKTLNNYNSSSGNSNLPSIYKSPLKFETTGTYSWKVPPGITAICIEVWGAGGGALNVTNNQNSGGGGGGGYGYGCFNVVPGTTFTVIVGAGGNGSVIGGSSSVGNLISATGGSPGTVATNCTSANGGVGGTSNASYNITGETGADGVGCPSNTLGYGGNGGQGANGGAGGIGGATFSNGTQGSAPGGGGGGTWTAPNVNNTPRSGGVGAKGQVYIYF